MEMEDPGYPGLCLRRPCTVLAWRFTGRNRLRLLCLSLSLPVGDGSPSAAGSTACPSTCSNNHDVNFNVAATNQAWAITTSNNYLQIAFGPSLEVRLFRGFSLCGEFLYHRLNYTKTSTATVDGNVTTIIEQTRATLWDAPMMIRWRGLAETGFLSHLYFAGGGAIRNVSHINTSNQTTNPDGSTWSNNIPAVPSARILPGAVAGVGMRFVDDFGVKLTPELRYTRCWAPRSIRTRHVREETNS
jgi:hypothetical protein